MKSKNICSVIVNWLLAHCSCEKSPIKKASLAKENYIFFIISVQLTRMCLRYCKNYNGKHKPNKAAAAISKYMQLLLIAYTAAANSTIYKS